MDLNLDDVKLKTADELTANEVEFLQENKDDLTEEDLSAYKQVLSSDDSEQDLDPDSGSGSEPESEEPEKTEDSEPDQFSFKSQEELDEYIDKKLAEKVPEKSEEPPEQPEEPVFYKDGEAPKDWNDALGKAVETAREEFKSAIEQHDQEKAKAAQDLQERISSINQEFERLADEGKLPEKGSEEFEKAKTQILDMGNKNKKPSVQEAFDLWSTVSAEYGGGYKANIDPQAEKKKAMKAQKKAASQVGSGGGSSDKKDPYKFSYKEDHGKSTDDLLDDIWTHLEG